MGKTSHAALRRQGYKLPPLQTVSLRIQADLWTRCAWKAAAANVDRSEFVRNALDNATRDAKPPEPRQFRGIEGTPAQLVQWERAAAIFGTPIDEFARQALDYAAKRLLQRKLANTETDHE